MASSIFQEFSIKTIIKKLDGECVVADETVMEIEGDARTILSVETNSSKHCYENEWYINHHSKTG